MGLIVLDNPFIPPFTSIDRFRGEPILLNCSAAQNSLVWVLRICSDLDTPAFSR
jgi:hypothetical protein